MNWVSDWSIKKERLSRNSPGFAETWYTAASTGSRGCTSPPMMYAASPITVNVCEDLGRASSASNLVHFADTAMAEVVSSTSGTYKVTACEVKVVPLERLGIASQRFSISVVTMCQGADPNVDFQTVPMTDQLGRHRVEHTTLGRIPIPSSYRRNLHRMRDSLMRGSTEHIP